MVVKYAKDQTERLAKKVNRLNEQNRKAEKDARALARAVRAMLVLTPDTPAAADIRLIGKKALDDIAGKGHSVKGR